MRDAFINGTGSYIPPRIVSNDELAPILGVTPDLIWKRTGIRNRRWAEPGAKTSDLAVKALRASIEDADVSASDIDYLILGTMTPDRMVPGTSLRVQSEAGLCTIPCLDIRGACCNALYALQIAKGLLQSSAARTVAICLSEIQSSYLDLSHTSAGISMLFGDGASAFIVSGANTSKSIRITDTRIESDGSFINSLGVRAPGTEFRTPLDSDWLPSMEGLTVIRHASEKMASACAEILERNGLLIEDVDWIVPHQANGNLFSQLASALNTGHERIFSVIEETGNTSSASMGIAFDTLRRGELLSAPSVLLLPAFGAGFSWGAALCEL